MGYYSNLRVALTKSDYNKMIAKNDKSVIKCNFILDPKIAYITEYSLNNTRCVLLEQTSFRYNKEFKEIQEFEKYLSKAKSGYVFFRIGSSWDDIEYRNTSKCIELEKPFKFIEQIREATLNEFNIEKSKSDEEEFE